MRVIPTKRGGDDRGISAVFFAISVSALITVGALVLGGSIGYSATRSAQTAADSAALAGTSIIRDHKRNWDETPADAVRQEIYSVAEDNGATIVPGGCELISAGYALSHSEDDVLGTCEELEFLDPELHKQVAGVRVSVEETRGIPFSAFVDRDTITGTASAAATGQPVRSARSPFMVCAGPIAAGHPAPALIPDDPEDPTSYIINPAAVGKQYVLWGNQIKNGGRDCGKPSSDWRGLVQYNVDFQLPSPDPHVDDDWWGTESGNSAGITGAGLNSTLAGGSCTLDSGESLAHLTPGCRIPVPLCPKANGDLDVFKLYCVEIGVFEITRVEITSASLGDVTSEPYPTPCSNPSENNMICGRFIGSGTASGGQGVAEQADPNALVVIKLVE